MLATLCGVFAWNVPLSEMTTSPMVVMRQQQAVDQALQPPNALQLFPTSMIASLQPEWLGKPAANKYNPGGAGNAEGNWWTPSSVLDTDCEGNKVTATTVLTKECIYEKKAAEIRARQTISSENGKYKVAKLAADEKKAEKAAEERAAARAEAAARQEKYAAKAMPKRNR